MRGTWTPMGLKADWPHPRNYPTHRHTPWTNNDSYLPFAALGKAEPLIWTTAGNGSAMTGRRYQVHYLPASRSIKILTLKKKESRWRSARGYHSSVTSLTSLWSRASHTKLELFRKLSCGPPNGSHRGAKILALFFLSARISWTITINHDLQHSEK